MSFDAFISADPDAAGGDGGDLEPPADGTYEVALTDAAFFTSKKGDAFVKLAWRVVSQQHTGFEWTVLLGFKSQGQANMSKKQVRELGIEVDSVTSPAALDQELKERVGGYFSVEVKTNGEYRNTYVNGPAVGSDVPIDAQAFSAEPAPADAGATDEEEIPF